MKTSKAWSGLVLVTMLITGCAESVRPTSYPYPTGGQSVEQQLRDRGECEVWAKQQTGYDPATETAVGAAVGAAIGALGGTAAGAAIGAATCSAGGGVAIGAATGAVGGAVVGGTYKYAKSREGFDQAFYACMSARGTGAVATAPAPAGSQGTPSAQAPPGEPRKINLLAASNGGQVLLAPNDAWLQTIDGKLGGIGSTPPPFDSGSEAVYAFKDEQPATFDTFSVFIPGANGWNAKEFELLVGKDSPTGSFRSLGKFQTQNVKVMKTQGWQEFKFPEVTATYLKVKVLSNHDRPMGFTSIQLHEFQLLGTFHEKATR
ncbi:MAG: hypothetical protein ACREJ6_10705 [Candidatus Methylomirabilis sp.]